MKRVYIICGILFMILLFGMGITKEAYAQANSTVISEASEFEINENGVLVKYNGKATIVYVPDTVKEIGYNAFSDCTFIEKIVLPEGLTAVGDSAFANCSRLKEINLPSELTQLSDNAFYGCTCLREITIPKGITEIDWHYFDKYNGIERINVSVDNEAFSSIDGVIFSKDKTSLIHYPVNRKDETYTIPDSVTTISEANFHGAKYLKHLVFGKNVALSPEGDYGFNGSHFMNGALESFSVPAENKYYCDIDGVLFTKDRKGLLVYPEKRAGKAYIIPDGTTTLHAWSFGKDDYSDMELQYIFVPDSVKEISYCVGFIGYYDGFGPNSDITFFGKKNSAIEEYAKDNNMRFGVYNSSNKNSQVLFDCTDISLELSETYKVNVIVWPLNSKETFTWKSSKKSVATVDKNGKITARGLGTATITVTAKSGASSSIKVTVRLPKPANVKAEKYSSAKNYAKISWNKVEGAKGYIVYQCEWQGYSVVPAKKLGTTSKTSFVDKSIKLDEQTHYAVVAYHNDKNCNSEGSFTWILIPSPPTGVSVEKSPDGVLIHWDEKFIYYNSGYEIYRSTSENGKYTKIATVSYNNKFIDTDAKPGKKYYYKIRAYDTNPDGKVYSNYTNPVGYTNK